MRVAVLVSIFFLIFVFQNCTPVAFNQQSQIETTESVSGGGGVDGKITYVNYGSCTGKTGVVSLMSVASDFSAAAVLREDCQDLSQASPVNVAMLNFMDGDRSILAYDKKIFDRQITLLPQPVTSRFCEASGTKVAVWKIPKTADFKGLVISPNGVRTKILSVLTPQAIKPNEYQSVPGQEDQMSLVMSGDKSGSLTYSVAGHVTNMKLDVTCLSQTLNATGLYDDGSSIPQGGTPQNPGLLSNYVLKPSWKVAGVDYAVGHPMGLSLKNPNSISGAGLSIDAAKRLVYVRGDNITLDGYDFSMNGGWALSIEGANNTRIINSYFLETSTQQEAPITGDSASKNLYVGYTTIDGGGASVVQRLNGLIAMNGQGLTVEYTWLKNAPNSVIYSGKYGVTTGGNLMLRYNLLENAGRAGLAGSYYLTLGSVSFDDVSVLFNTSVQTQDAVIGWWIDNTAQSAEIGNNVMVTTGVSSGSTLTRINYSVGRGTFHDNFFDMSGAYYFAYPGSANYGVTFSNNFNMLTGAQLSNSP